MAALSLSKFHEPDWDTKLDNMLADLETGTGSGTAANNFSFQQQQQQFSYSSSQQQMVGGSVTQQQQKSFSSSARSHQATGPKNAGGFSLKKSASNVSLKDSAGDVLKDLENGLVKSSHFIKESHGKVVGPDGTQEWHDVQRGGDPPGNGQAFDLEMQNNRYGQQQQIQHFEDTDDRPGSRLKQNIDELDNLLYDLNHARNVTPDTDTYGNNAGLDSDDYSESVGKEGHVKRTVHAFNEYSAQMSTSPELATKPPSPSPRRKATSSPSSSRRAPQPTAVGGQSYFSQQQQISSSQSYMSSQQNSASYTTQTKNEYLSGGQTTYSPPPSINYPTNGGGNNHYLPDNEYPTSKSPDVAGGGRFPATSARSPTPQHMPKQVDELMSEFQEFDSTISNSVSPKPMFSKQTPPIVQVTGPTPDSEPNLPCPAPVVRNPSPPKPAPAPTAAKGPGVYYPPGHEFAQQFESRNKATTVIVPAAAKEPKVDSNNGNPVVEADASGGAMAMQGGSSGAMASMRMESRKERYAREEKEATQGAAMIPICLPLCCAAPCVIM